MKVTPLATGSKGNCIAVQEGDTCILIDAGEAKTKIEKMLNEAGIRADSIEAIFVTHPHGDHIKGLTIANKYRIPVYIGEEEVPKINKIDEELVNPINTKNLESVLFDFEGYQDYLEIKPFLVHHDSYAPLGYVISSAKEIAAICLDTGKVDDTMIEAMKGSDIYVLEANHSPNMLETTGRPNHLKARILSDIGHLSNEQAAVALSQLIEGKNEIIHLAHLSSEANADFVATATVERALRRKGLVKGKHYTLEVAN